MPVPNRRIPRRRAVRADAPALGVFVEAPRLQRRRAARPRRRAIVYGGEPRPGPVPAFMVVPRKRPRGRRSMVAVAVVPSAPTTAAVHRRLLVGVGL